MNYKKALVNNDKETAKHFGKPNEDKMVGECIIELKKNAKNNE